MSMPIWAEWEIQAIQGRRNEKDKSRNGREGRHGDGYRRDEAKITKRKGKKGKRIDKGRQKNPRPAKEVDRPHLGSSRCFTPA